MLVRFERKSAIFGAVFRVPSVSRVFRKCVAHFPIDFDPKRTNTSNCERTLFFYAKKILKKKNSTTSKSRRKQSASTCTSSAPTQRQVQSHVSSVGRSALSIATHRFRHRRPFGHPGPRRFSGGARNLDFGIFGLCVCAFES